MRRLGIEVMVFWTVAASASGAELPKAPVPKSPYIAVVYRYADTMIERGRDTYGPRKTGLFLSALDRGTLAPLTNRPTAPSGVREADRVGAARGPLAGANVQHDENLLRLLYLLSELTTKPKYRDAADAGLKWFLQNAAFPGTGFLPWDQRRSWDVMADKPAGDDSAGSRSHEFFRPWLLWDRCFALAPETSKGFARALLPGQEANRHRVESPRDAGICIRTWAAAYAQTKDEQFLRAIETLLETFEKKPLQASASIEGASPASTLSLAIDCHGAAHSVPGSLASRLRGLAWRQDEAFCALNHDLKHAAGFLTGMSPTNRLPGATATPRWNARLGGHTTAQVGLMCVARYDNGGGKGHRDLILAAADAYLDSMPPEGAGVWPGTFGQAISLQLAAWRHSARPVYLQRARTFADSAIEKFWGANALPRASLTSEHYETITGADTLALSLVELHLHVLHITAVRCPLNTLDR